MCGSAGKSVFCGITELEPAAARRPQSLYTFFAYPPSRGIGWSSRFMNLFTYMYFEPPSSLPNPKINKIPHATIPKTKVATFAYHRHDFLKSPLTHNVCILPTAPYRQDLAHNICMFSTADFQPTDTHFRHEKVPIFCVGLNPQK